LQGKCGDPSWRGKRSGRGSSFYFLVALFGLPSCMTGKASSGAAATLIAVVVIFAAIYLAGSVFAPVAFALFIIALVWPLQSLLQSYLPKLLALAIVILVTVVLFVAFASLIFWGFSRVARWVVSDAARYQVLYDQVAVWLESHGIAIAGLWAEHFNVGWLIRALREITGLINATTRFWVVVLVYVILGLLEVEDIGCRIRAMENREASRVLLDGSLATAVKFRRYMLVRTLMSLMTGALVWGFVRFAGLPLAVEWGVVAFALNYIPFIGPFVATVFPTLFALAQFASWQAALAVFAGLNLIQFVVGSYIEPRLFGRALAISPFVVLFAVFFWAFVWGLFGAFIGVPVTIAVLTFSAQHPSTSWLADLLGSPGGGRVAKKVA
jgi:AI-2 transport protein TqsA